MRVEVVYQQIFHPSCLHLLSWSECLGQSTHDAHRGTSLAVHVVYVTTHSGIVRGALLMRPQRVVELLLGGLTFRTEGANMKLAKICAVGAILCGPSFCQAQVKFFDSVDQVRSILVAADDTSLQPAAAANAQRESSSQFANAEVTVDGGENPFPAGSPLDVASASDLPVNNTDPSSLPVGLHHRRNAIDQILQNGLIAQTPNAAFAPVAWPGREVADNPTARSMLYTRCNINLWDNYAAEQAAECARIQAHLTPGHGHHHGCATCPPVGCAPVGCATGSCGHGGHGGLHARLNRYTGQLAGKFAGDSAVGCDCASAPVAQSCATCQAGVQQHANPAIPTVQPLSPEAPSMQPSLAPALVPAPIGAVNHPQPHTAAVPGSFPGFIR